MGVKNLLVTLSPLATKVNLARYGGQTLGVDAMCWMHRGAVASATSQFLGQNDDKFLKYVMSMVKLMYTFKIKPLLVFDGCRLPLKAVEEHSRYERRIQAAEEAKKLIAEKHALDSKAVQSKIAASASVSPLMIRKLIKALKVAKVEYMVAPFESDAQLAYLCRSGIINAVVTEDSDLLAYGCPRVIYKLNAAGDGQEICLDGVLKPGYEAEKDPEIEKKGHVKIASENKENRPPFSSLNSWVKRYATLEEGLESKKSKKTDTTVPFVDLNQMSPKERLLQQLSNFDHSMMAGMCVLSGCDYSNDFHISGLGVKSAISLISEHRSLGRALTILLRRRYSDDSKRHKKVSSGEGEIFRQHVKAYSVFKYHRVFDPRQRKLADISSAPPGSKLTTSATLFGIDLNLKEIVGELDVPEDRLQQHVLGIKAANRGDGSQEDLAKRDGEENIEFSISEQKELETVKRGSLILETRSLLLEAEEWGRNLEQAREQHHQQQQHVQKKEVQTKKEVQPKKEESPIQHRRKRSIESVNENTATFQDLLQELDALTEPQQNLSIPPLFSLPKKKRRNSAADEITATAEILDFCALK